MNNQEHGDLGEREVVDLVPCPNCQKKLMLLPKNYPLYDVQCTACNFRAQVKTNNREPKNVVFGAGYDIYEEVMKAGFLAPPLILNFRWLDKKGAANREIRFYPFVAKGNIKKYTLSANAKRANYRMFRYEKLDKIPFIVMHTLYDPEGLFDRGLPSDVK